MKNFNIQYPCSNCESLLLVEKEDIIIRIKENKEIYYTFKCSCCNIENEIVSKLIPLNIKINTLKNLRHKLKGTYI